MYQISRADAKDLPAIWPKLQAQIQRGLSRGAGDSLSEHALYNGVMTGRLDLWVMHRDDDIHAGVFLQIVQRERGTALFVVDVVAGSGHGFKDYAEEFLPKLREYGDMIGAYTIESISRPGAARILKRLGCKPKAIMMELRNG